MRGPFAPGCVPAGAPQGPLGARIWRRCRGRGSKVNLLLDLFLFPGHEENPDKEKRRWTLAELEQATDGELGTSYLSQFKRGKSRGY